MTDHLPECREYDKWEVFDAEDGHKSIRSVCICPALRAYGQRLERENRPIDVRATRLAVQDGYEQGVQAARDAVAAISPDRKTWKSAVLAAIDALRGES